MALSQAQLDIIKQNRAKKEGIAPAENVSRQDAMRLLSLDKVQSQVKEREQGFFQKLGQDLSKRSDNIIAGAKKGFGLAKEAFQARGEQPAVNTALQMAGGIAGATVVTPIMESIGSLFDVIKQATPEEVKRPISEALKAGFNTLAEKGPQFVKPEEVKYVMDKYQEAVARDPSIGRDLEAAANLFATAFSVKDIGEGFQGMNKVAKGTEDFAKAAAKKPGQLVENVQGMIGKVEQKIPGMVETGSKVANDIIPTRGEVISGQITKALDLTQGDVSNIKLSTGNEVGEWIANKNVIGGNKKETIGKIKGIVDTQYKSVRNEIAKVPTVYTSETAPRVVESLKKLEQETKDVLGLEKVSEEIGTLLSKPGYSLTDIQRTKELIDDQFDLYKATGDVKAGNVKAGLGNVRKELKEFIETEVKNTTGADIRAMNNDVSTGKNIMKLANKRATRGFTRANVSLSDLGFFGAGSIVGTPLVGAAALLGKRIIETPAFRLKFAKFLDSLPKKEVEVIKGKLLKGEVPDQVKSIVSDFKGATVPETVYERALKPTDSQAGEYLYHGTNEQMLESISKEGLKPSRRGTLSLSKDEAYSKSFAIDGMTPQGKTNGVMFRVKADFLKGKTVSSNKPRPATDELYEVLTKKVVPPESLEVLKNGKWVSLKDTSDRLAKTTKFDTEKVRSYRAQQDKQISTHLINTPERISLRKSIVEKIINKNKAIKKEKIVNIIMGPPASGKSSVFAEPLSKKWGARIVDADEAKEFLPEFNKGKFAGVVHEESSDIALEIMKKSVRQGENIILPLVGKNEAKILQISKLLKKKGYTVNLYLNNVPPEVAAQRAVSRLEDTGRFVDPYYVLNEVADRPLKTFENIKNNSLFNYYEHRSNNVARGETPELIEAKNTSPRG